MPNQRAILAIDLSDTSVKLAYVIDGQIEKKAQLEATPETQVQVIRQFIQENLIGAKEAVVTLPLSAVHIKQYSLSKTEAEDAVGVIKWKLAEELAYPIEEALFDLYPLADQNYLAACIKQQDYKQVQALVSELGLKLTGIPILADCLGQAYAAELADGHVVVLHMGKLQTEINIYNNGLLEFNHTINFGGQTITEAMTGVLVGEAGRVELNNDQAEELKRANGVPLDLAKFPKLDKVPVVQLQAMLCPVIERLIEEIKRSFEYYQNQIGEIDLKKLIFSGGGAKTIQLADFLTQELGLAIVIPEEVDAQYAELLGAAELEGQEINLMPEEVKHRWEIVRQKVSQPPYLLAALIGVLLLIYFILSLQISSAQKQLVQANQKMVEYKPRLAVLEVLEKTAKADERKKLAFLSREQKGSLSANVFEELSRLIPKTAVIKVLSVSRDDLHLWGTVFQKGEAAENILAGFVLKLSQANSFSDVELFQATKNKEYRETAFDFEIVAKVRDDVNP